MSRRLKMQLKELLAKEEGAVVREWGARFPIALVFPQVYPVAMSNLGFQAVYRLLNDTPDLHCERAFMADPLTLEEHRRTHTPSSPSSPSGPLRTSPWWPSPSPLRPTIPMS